MQKQKSLGLNALLNSLQSLLNLIFPLITFPYISRTLSVDGVGKYNFANSIVSYFLLIAALGISTFAVREGSKYRDDRKQISRFASQVFTINLVATAAAYLLLFITMIAVPILHNYTAAILIFSVQIFFTTLGTDWVYTIFEEYGYITVRNLIFKVISIILLFIFVRQKDDYLNYVIITVIASTGSYILNFLHARKFCDIKLTLDIPWKAYLLPIFTIFGSTVAIKIYVGADTTMLGFMKSDYEVGIYSTSTKIYSIAGQMLMAMLAVTIPRLAMLMGQKRMEEYNKLLKQLINTVLFIVLPGIIGLFAVSHDVIILIAGVKYLRAVVALRISCFAILGSAMSTIFNQCALMPAKREKKTLISSTTSACLNIGLNLILIPLMAERGAALTTLLAEFTMMSMNYYFSRDITGFVFKDKKTWENIATVLIGCAGVAVVCLLCSIAFKQMFVRLAISVIGSAAVYAGILLGLKNSVMYSFLEQAKAKMKR
ncbi:Membrane protein involved in the export of O-antigen and teichoic acid [Ligilactobacillus sp. WC1T17]|uniref:Membrane protein involved in the export of O-antigen and teichoic acid n=1 Tax=Ligilactobacillus ruminis TaxID=1623 RepID=A0ABY1A8W2_9LACO|nr:Membrane protein involved in the export of O-antigen and teichoic acid [Ligilactobacillus ruminis]